MKISQQKFIFFLSFLIIIVFYVFIYLFDVKIFYTAYNNVFNTNKLLLTEKKKSENIKE